ncbi:MAG TPA: heme-copper oxidase subunit III [Ktedonobacteraceae bacterium]|nr:heme-copper oxidase subunit III [Ktedonobacteraceae bacterium]
MSVTHGEQIRTLEEHEAPGRSLGWWGMIFFIASEALIFANLIAAYLYLEIRNGNWPVPSELWFPLVNTIILLASSFPVHWAGTSAAKGNMRNVKLGFLASIIMGAYFLGGQIYEYSGLFGKHFTPQSSVAGSAFFTLTGFHGAHVTVGLIFLFIIWLRTMRGNFTAKRHFPIEAAEMYWHFVDGVWVIVFSTVYLLPLLRG